MKKYEMEREAYYLACRDFLYSEIAKNPKLKNATIDELADIALAKKWQIFLPDGIRMTVTEKAASRVLSIKNRTVE